MGPQAGGPTVVVPTVDPDHPVELGTMASVKSSGCCWRTRCEMGITAKARRMTRRDPVR